MTRPLEATSIPRRDAFAARPPFPPRAEDRRPPPDERRRRAPRMHLGSVLLAAGCLFGIGCPGTGRLSGDDDAPPGPDQEDAGARSEADPSPEAPRGSDRPARDPDLDDDGLDDRIELALGTDAAQEDSDGDGWLDGVERRAGTDPLDPTATPPGDARQIVLDPDTPRTVTLPFVARVSRGNVFFLVDGTGSMAAVIDGIRDTLSEVIVPGLRRVLVDPALGLGVFRDFPRDGHGAPGDQPFELRAPLARDAAAIRSTLATVRARGGGDVPEALVEALGALTDGDCPSASAGEGGVGPTPRGPACFEPGAFATVVAITDAPSHNGPAGAHPYAFPARSYDEVVAALRRGGIRVLGVHTDPVARPHLEALASDTRALDDGGAPLVFPSGPDGEVGGVIVDAVQDLVARVEADASLDFERSGDGPGDDRGLAWLVATEALGATPPARARHPRRFEGLRGGAQGAFGLTFEARGDCTEGGRALIRPLRARVRAWPRGDVLAEQVWYLVARPVPPGPLR